MTGREIAERTREQLAKVTSLEPGIVSAVSKEKNDGWRVSVDMVELRRIPNTTDVLAVYQAVADDEGNLVSYKRTRRYLRNQVITEE